MTISHNKYEIRYARLPGGQRLAYGVLGEGPPLVHPPPSLLTSHFSREPARWGRLSDRFMLVTYDHLGSGLSDRESYDYTLDGKEAELTAVLDAAGLDRIAILGWSGSGPLAIRFAATHPERVSALVLLATFARPSDYAEGTRFQSMRQTFEADWDLGVEAWVRLVAWGSDEPYDEQVARIHETCEPAAYFSSLDVAGEHDVTDLLGAVSVPTLVVANSANLYLPQELSRELAASIKGARFFDAAGDRAREQEEIARSRSRTLTRSSLNSASIPSRPSSLPISPARQRRSRASATTQPKRWCAPTMLPSGRLSGSSGAVR